MSVRKKTPWQRTISLLLCVAMLLSFMPVTVWAVEEDNTEPENTAIADTAAEAAENTADTGEESTESTEETPDDGIDAQAAGSEYVSLPVVIRDFAADGMLFEFNQAGVTPPFAVFKSYEFLVNSATNANFDWGSNSNRGFRIRPYAVFQDKLPSPSEYWHCVICNAEGEILKVLVSSGVSKQEEYSKYMTTGCYSIWIWVGDGTADTADAKAEYEAFAELVNERTKDNFRISYDTTDGTFDLKARFEERNGQMFFLGDNNGFTLLTTNDNQYINNLNDSDDIPGTQLIENGYGWTTEQGAIPDPVTVELNSTAKQQVYGANIRTDLVASRLDKDGKPIYTEATVDYLADLLYTMLNVPYQIKVDDDTYYRTSYYLTGTELYDKNFQYVGKGDAATYDLADVLRNYIWDNGGLMGSYADSKTKFEAGSLSIPQNVSTYYDAAYFLLHNIWRDSAAEGHNGNDGYGWNTWNYNKINLRQTTNEAGQKCYVFNSGYEGVVYDYMNKDAQGNITGTGAIYNPDFNSYPGAIYPSWAGEVLGGEYAYTNGVQLPEARFDPLGQSGSGLSFGYGMKADVYGDMLNAKGYWGDFYENTNYHLTLEGHAKFIYYKDAAQYFTFTGDDDVYLYINGVRVLDLGGAHSIAKVKINMNDVAQLCGLKDGNTYTFDFFYMERHGTAANFGIETNIQIVDPSMLTTKTGYQDGENTGYNGFVDPEKPVVYEFALANNGDADIQYLTFTDEDIGVKLTADSIVLDDQTKVGNQTELEDLSVTLYDKDGNVVSSVAAGSLTEDALKQYLIDGLKVGQKIVIHGFKYQIQPEDWDCRYVDENGSGDFDEGDDRASNWYFFNIIYTTATAVASDNLSTRELTGTSNWVVQQEGDGGPVTDKTVAGTDDPNEFELTLEAYALGQTQTATEEKTTPSDIVLVLDQSASMFSPAGGNAGYDNSERLGRIDSSVAVEDLKTDKAAHMGYYVAQSTDGRGHTEEDMVYDWFVVQYIDGKWYYVRKDETAKPAALDMANANTGSANVLGETLVRDEPIGTFNYYQSGYGALYDSVCQFVDGVKESGVDHRIAVVGFASPCYDAMEFFDGSGVYLDGKYYLYDTEYLEDEGGIYTYTYNEGLGTKRYLTAAEIAALKQDNAAEVYGQALVDVTTGYDSIMASVNAVTTNYWHTCPAAGLDMANQIFEANPAGERDRIVVLFTDGMPTIRIGADYENGKNWTDKDENGLYYAHVYWSVAQGKDNALEQAYITKNTHGAKIHAVGTSAVEGELFLSGVSSDYPDAEDYPTYYTDENGVNHSYEDDQDPPTEAEVRALLGASIPSPKYTYVTSDNLDLTTIFTTILESTTTTRVEADANSVLREVLTDYFVLDSESVADVKVYTAVYNGDGTYAEAVERKDLSCTLSSSEGEGGRLDTIDVAGFNYRDEYISSVVRYRDGEPYYGSKLIVKVRIRTRDGFWGGNNVPTNESTTGIYNEDGDELSKFPEPQVNVPLSLTLEAEDAVVYYGSDDLGAGLLKGITAGGENVIVGPDGSLQPQAEWMDDYADLNWTEDSAKPGDDLSSTESDTYTYAVTLTPKTDGLSNTSSNPNNMAGTPVDVTGMGAEDDAKVEILVPVVYFQDSTITREEKLNDAYFAAHNLVDGVDWVLMDAPASTKAATHGSAPALSFDYHFIGIITEAIPVNVTVTGQYGTNAPIEMTGVSYFDWVTCHEALHDDAEGTIERHLGSTAGQNEFWVHVPDDIPSQGLITDKYVEATEDPNEFVLTLEAYASGQQEAFTKPADIVLVLDHSGSMRTPVGATEVQYSPVVKDNVTVKEGKLYTGGGEINRSQINVEKAKHRGYYVAQSKETLNWFVMEYVVDFELENGSVAERWVGYLVPSTESIVDTTPGNYTEHTKVLSWVPGTVDSDLIFYKSQYAVLYDALLEFVEDLKDSGVEHNVSIVGFAGSETWGTRLYVGSEGETGYKYYRDHLYHENTSQERREELYRLAMKNVQDATEYAELISNINLIETNHSFTCPTAGLQLANEVFAANAADMADRDRIVVLFTDGIPNRMMGENTDVTVDEAKQNAIYDEIVKKAYETKSTYNAQVYSICTTTLAEGVNGENRTFLDYSSSNYPNAQSYSEPGEKLYTRYFHTIKDFETLSNVFKTITQSTTSVALDETASLKEVLTDYFVLNPDDTVDVEIYTAAYNGDGTFAEPVRRTEAEGYKYVLSSSEGTDRMDTIDVTGFDYADEYLSSIARTGEDGSSYYGSKLIVKVRIRTRNGFWGGNNVPTNEDSTAIYTPEGTDGDGNKIPGKPVVGFPEPEVNVPVDVEVEAKDKTIYYTGDVTAEDLLERITAGGVDVIIDGDKLTPQESWMDDYADLSWTADSTKPGDTPSNTTPDDYTFEVQLTPKYDGTQNRQDDPSNIAGNPVTSEGDSAADTGHVYILVPELTFEDSVTEFGTPTEGYDYDGKDYVSTEIKWVNMETGLPEGTVVPPVSGTAPGLDLSYTPEGDVTEFLGDTKVDVTVKIGDLDITDLTNFKWKNCEHKEHENCGVIGTHKGGTDCHEFWVHVTISILPDTVVIDFGLPVDIHPLVNDLAGYSAASDKVLVGIGPDFTEAYTGAYGDAVVLDGDTVRYTIDTMQMPKEETFAYQGKYTIRGDDKVLDSTITVIPATIIYYEDSFLTYKVYEYVDENYNSRLTNETWETVGKTAEAVQGEDRPGEDLNNALADLDADNIYGYDPVYEGLNTYSLGSARKLTVDADTYGTAEFTFDGTGFDVVSLTDSTTGTILVRVWKQNADGTRGPSVKNLMVDTYYGYKYVLCNVTYVCKQNSNGELYWEQSVDSEAGQGAVEAPAQLPEDPQVGQKITGVEYAWFVDSDLNAEDEYVLYQVPVMKVENLDYGTYQVEITISYSSFLDHNEDGEDSFYLDAIRIYDPANDGAGNKVIEDAYKADGEGWPSYQELRNLVIAANDFDALTEGEQSEGIIFIDNTLDTNYEWKYTISDYRNYGPNNELYLAPGQSVAFDLNATGNVAAVHLALKTVGGNSAVKVCGVSGSGDDLRYTYALGSAQGGETITTATDLYYDITDLNGKTVVIANPDTSGNAIVSITNIKTTYTANPSATEITTFSVSREAARMALKSLETAAAAPEPVNPFVDVPEDTFYYDPVLWAVDQGITNGMDVTHFGPDAVCNRAQVVTFLWRAAGCPESALSKHTFVDVQEDAYYYKAILWAVEKGITNGVDATHFAPEATCNRAQVVTFLHRAMGSPTPGTAEHSFTDVDETAFYYSAMLWAVEKGITNGMDAVSFGPTGICNRAQVVTFLYRAYH